MLRVLRLPALLATCTLALTTLACNTGTSAGDTNVEKGSNKERTTNHPELSNGDSTAAGLSRDTSRLPTGKEQYKAAGQAKDSNHDGIAD